MGTWQPLKPADAMRNGKVVDIGDQELWMNDQYVVHKRVVEAIDGREPMIHLSIRNDDRSTRHDWRDFQRIKNQLAGPEYEGLEVYPAESRKVDTANQYHLFCFPFSMGFGLGTQRIVTNHDVTAVAEPGAVQADNDPVDGPLNSLEELLEWKDRHSLPDEED